MRQNVGSPLNILVVEDEPVIGLFIQDTLEVVGFDVEVTATASEARARFNDAAAAFDAAIIDIALPDEPGDRLACEVRAQQPNLPIVVASAVRPEILSLDLAHDPNVCVIEKPYDGVALVSALRALHVRPGAEHKIHRHGNE